MDLFCLPFAWLPLFGSLPFRMLSFSVASLSSYSPATHNRKEINNISFPTAHARRREIGRVVPSMSEGLAPPRISALRRRPMSRAAQQRYRSLVPPLGGLILCLLRGTLTPLDDDGIVGDVHRLRKIGTRVVACLHVDGIGWNVLERNPRKEMAHGQDRAASASLRPSSSSRARAWSRGVEGSRPMPLQPLALGPLSSRCPVDVGELRPSRRSKESAL